MNPQAEPLGRAPVPWQYCWAMFGSGLAAEPRVRLADKGTTVKATKLAAFITLFWLLLVGLVIAEVGTVPSSTAGWCLLISFGPVGYLLASAIGEFGMAVLTQRLGFGPVGRVALLLLILFPILVLAVYLTNR